MARTVEESIMNAIKVAFVDKAQVSKPSKSYMAIGNSIPKVGEHFKCKKLEKNANGEIRFSNTETTTVQEVKKAAGNVFIVATRNSYYVTRVLHMPAENIHFAIVKEEPKIGSSLHCYKLEFKGENCRCVSWQTTKVIKVNNVHGLYKVQTKNSYYVCFPM
jgi:hypothetical protein